MCLGCLTTNGRLLMEELTMADHTQNQHASICRNFAMIRYENVRILSHVFLVVGIMRSRIIMCFAFLVGG